MNQLISYIEFLILQHDYVIIPDFGGFVLNKEPAGIRESGKIYPPVVKVGFNEDLKFNDGILAGFYMQEYSLPYDSACKRIEEGVKQIRHHLARKKEIKFGNLGTLTFKDDNFVFSPDTQSFVHPTTWGYGEVDFLALTDLSYDTERIKKKLPLKRVLVVAASSAAALLLALTPSLTDNDLKGNSQQSGFFVDFYNHIAQKIDYRSLISQEKETTFDNYIAYRKELQLEKEKKQKVNIPVIPLKRYYLIVGGDTDKTRAKSIESQFRNQGFKDASIVEAPDRYRVFVVSFDDKDKANIYLEDFRQKYPKYSDAWLYTKRIN